jgi:hypothetical protein
MERAALASELMPHRKELLEASTIASPSEMPAKLSALNGGTPLEKAFIMAMQWRIKTLTQ